MYRSSVVVLILQIYVVCIGPVDANCDTNESPCVCVTLDKGTTAINCSAVFPKLTEIPKVPYKTTIFDLSNNRIRPDALHELCEYTYLEEVSISRNHLNTIPAKELMRCLITRSLNLSGNVFDAISHDSLKGLEMTPAIYGLESLKFTDLTISSMVRLRLLDLIVHQTEIPNTLLNKLRLQSLYLDIRSATELPVRFLDPIAATLERLQLISNVLDKLQESLLHKSQTLAELYLQLPALGSVPTNFFQTPSLTSKLKTIVLKGIKSLPRNVFSSLNGLRSLDVHEAEDLPSGLFNGLRYLETLDLTGTHFVTIPKDWFTDLWNLRRLVLRSTGIQSISKTDISNMKQLRHVDLSKNEIRYVPSHFFHEISETVSFIDLSYNDLKMISNDLFNGHSSLKKLYLNDNQISSIQPGAFVSLSELRELYLQNNKLDHVGDTLFVNTRNITHLDLSLNILTSLPAGIFQNTRKIRSLILSDNRISYLDESIQLRSSSLHEFDVKYNDLRCNCSTWRLKFSLTGARVIGDCSYETTGETLTLNSYFLLRLDCPRITPTSKAPSVADNGVFQLTSSDSNSLVVSSAVLESSFVLSYEETAQNSGHIMTAHTSYIESTSVYVIRLQNFTSTLENIIPTGDLLDLSTDRPWPRFEHLSATVHANISPTPVSKSQGEYASTVTTSGEIDQHSIYEAVGKISPTEVNVNPRFEHSSATVHANISPTPVSESQGEYASTVTASDDTDQHSIYSIYDAVGNFTTVDFFDLNITENYTGGFTSKPAISPAEVNVNPEKANTDFYIALSCIIVVSVACVFSVGYMCYRRRRQVVYQVSTEQANIENEIFPTDTPSIHIERVDDDGNIRVETFPATET